MDESARRTWVRLGCDQAESGIIAARQKEAGDLERYGEQMAAALKARMAGDFGVEIAGAFGLDIVRIGQMGEQCHPEHLFRCLYAFGESLRREGFPADVAAGMAALSSGLQDGVDR